MSIYLVLGSAPDVLLPPANYQFAGVYCANGAVRIAADAGLGPVTLFTHAGFANGPASESRSHMFRQWKGLGVSHAFVDETDGSAEDMRSFFRSLDMRVEALTAVPYEVRGRIVESVAGKNLGQGPQAFRVSTGVFAICAAFAHGAEHVMIAGISLNGGHYGSSETDPRHHLLGDVECLRLLAKRGRCSTTQPGLSAAFGFPLVVAKGNEQRVAYQQSHATASEAVACLEATFDLLGRPARMVDFGSGAGHLVDRATDAGVVAVGLDLYRPAPGTRGTFYAWNLGTPWPGGWGDGADLVLCWETAEHIAPEGADALCANVRAAVGRGGFLVFTAAVPGQGGSGHLNEQPHEYWAMKFAALGLLYAPHITATLRSAFVRAAPNAWWYGRNALVFQAPK